MINESDKNMIRDISTYCSSQSEAQSPLAACSVTVVS